MTVTATRDPTTKPPNCSDHQPKPKPKPKPRKKKEKEKTQKQLIMDLLKINKKILDDIKNYAATAKSIQTTQTKLQLTYKKVKEELEKFKETFDDIQDTQLNCLVAIRQNEYLKARYPAQQGYQAMKVAGHHPTYTDRKKKNGKAKN